jgi:SnoaL-like protein
MPDAINTATPALSAAEGANTAAVDATIEAYVATWNETDPARRRAGIARAWAEAGRYRDPLMASDGPAEMDALLAGVQAKFPGFVLRRTSKVDAHNGACRFTWSLGPAAGPAVVEGVDFCALAPDGRLVEVVGFIDKMPG